MSKLILTVKFGLTFSDRRPITVEDSSNNVLLHDDKSMFMMNVKADESCMHVIKVHLSQQLGIKYEEIEIKEILSV